MDSNMSSSVTTSLACRGENSLVMLSNKVLMAFS